MSELAARIRGGDVRAISRAATWIESRDRACEPLLSELFSASGKATIVGITGAPGAGKSSIADRLIVLLRATGRRVGVISVDPSSPFSGGAILGDRIRMERHHTDGQVFIRSMASRGHLGGIAAATSDVALLLDAAGFDTILIETVGVGQDEVAVARIANATVVVLVPGMGDDVQALKAGIMEIADVYAINKSDHDGTERLEREIHFVLGLAPRNDGWVPPIVRTVATAGTGIEELWAAVESFLDAAPRRERARRAWEFRLLDLFRERATAALTREQIERAAEAVLNHRISPYDAVDEWIKEIRQP